MCHNVRWRITAILKIENSISQQRVDSTATKPGAPALKTAQNKIDRYAELPNTHIFYLFSVETAGTWHDIAIEMTEEIDRRITMITEDARETTFLFQRPSIALQRENAVSFHHTMVTE